VYSALGTPLDWEDAKKNAQQVREWGIQVRIPGLVRLNAGGRTDLVLVTAIIGCLE
jgi:hypothetical protein